MNIFKKLLYRYGVMFFFSFLGSFILFVTLVGKNENAFLMPLDLRIKTDAFTIYMPFGSAIVLGAAATVGFEVYKFFKK